MTRTLQHSDEAQLSWMIHEYQTGVHWLETFPEEEAADMQRKRDQEMIDNNHYYIGSIIDMKPEVRGSLPAIFLIRYWGENLDTAEWVTIKDIFAQHSLNAFLEAKRQMLQGRRKNAMITTLGAEPETAASKFRGGPGRNWDTRPYKKGVRSIWKGDRNPKRIKKKLMEERKLRDLCVAEAINKSCDWVICPSEGARIRDKTKIWGDMIAEISKYLRRKYRATAISEVFPDLATDPNRGLGEHMKDKLEIWRQGVHYIGFRTHGQMGHCIALRDGDTVDEEDTKIMKRCWKARTDSFGIIFRLESRLKLWTGEEQEVQ